MNIENKIRGIFRVPSGCNFIVLGAVTMNFGMIRHKKCFLEQREFFKFFFQVLLLFVELKM